MNGVTTNKYPLTAKVIDVADGLFPIARKGDRGPLQFFFEGDPLIKEDGEFREASWDEALDMVANRFMDIKNQHGADTIGMLTSARVTNEENYIANKFTRAVLKTNNIDHCARL